jgi:hypothetical protein
MKRARSQNPLESRLQQQIDSHNQGEVVQDIMAEAYTNYRHIYTILNRGTRLPMTGLNVRDHRRWVGNWLYVPEHYALRSRLSLLWI